MATDIAFAVLGRAAWSRYHPDQTLLADVGNRGRHGCNRSYSNFLHKHLSTTWLLTALVGLMAVWVLQKIRVWAMPVYAVLGMLFGDRLNLECMRQSPGSSWVTHPAGHFWVKMMPNK